MVKLKLKFQFFDSPAVERAVGKSRRGVLSRIGAFLRRRARSSLRKRKGTAAAGSPPSVHEGGLKRLLFFGYDPGTQSVVVGPAPYRDGRAPQLLEFGGDVRGKHGARHYAGNPFMAPALNAEAAAGTIPRAWANSVKGG